MTLDRPTLTRGPPSLARGPPAALLGVGRLHHCPPLQRLRALPSSHGNDCTKRQWRIGHSGHTDLPIVDKGGGHSGQSDVPIVDRGMAIVDRRNRV